MRFNSVKPIKSSAYEEILYPCWRNLQKLKYKKSIV